MAALDVERQYGSYWESPINIYSEIEAGEKERNKAISTFQESLRKYQGPGRLEMAEESFLPYNYYYEWISLVRPQIAFQNPVVKIRSKREDVNQLEAVALEFYVNRWIRDSHYIRTVERATTFQAFNFGATLTTLEACGGDFDDPRSRPRKIVMDPGQFGMDAGCRSWEEAKILFHRVVEDREDLLERAEKEGGWDMDAIRSMPTFTEGDKIGRPKDFSLDRGEVCYYWGWLPGDGDDADDANGQVVVVGLNQGLTGDRKPKFLKSMESYYGPRWGPYTLWDFYFVPRSPWPMGPLQAQEGLVRSLNAQARVNLRRARGRKDLFLFDEVDIKSAEKIANAPDGSGVGLPQFEKSKFEMSQIGGVNEDELAYEQWLDGLLKRGGGLSDAELGNTKGGQTATSDAIAATGSAARKGYLENKVYDAVKRDLTSVAYFAWKEETVYQPLGDEFRQRLMQMGAPASVVEQLRGVPLEWRGGEKGSFDDLELEVEPRSMARPDEGAEKAEALQFTQALAQLAPLVSQSPWMPWRDIFNDLGRKFNYTGLGDRIDVQGAGAVGMAQIQAGLNEQQAASQGGGGASQPRMGSDIGIPRQQRPSELGKGSGALPGQNSGAKVGAKIRGKT